MARDTGVRDVAIAGIGATPYYKRGETADKSITQLAGEAILAACADAGVSVTDVDGLAFYSLGGADRPGPGRDRGGRRLGGGDRDGAAAADPARHRGRVQGGHPGQLLRAAVRPGRTG